MFTECLHSGIVLTCLLREAVSMYRDKIQRAGSKTSGIPIKESLLEVLVSGIEDVFFNDDDKVNLFVSCDCSGSSLNNSQAGGNDLWGLCQNHQGGP